MRTLREMVEAFRRSGRAIGHFNISDSNQLKAIAGAAREADSPVLIGLSEGERAFFPIAQVRALIDLYNREGTQLHLSADHTYSLEKAKAAIDQGVDAIVVDGAKLGEQDNIALVKSCVEYARASGRDVLVEGELGYIGQSSEMLERLPEGVAVTEAMMTKPQDAAAFAKETAIDMLAPAVGNIHGIVASGQPKLSIDRIREIASAVPVPLVLHGGSGISDGEFTSAVKAGIAIIHVNTELRRMYKQGIERAFHQMPHELAPYKLLAQPVADMHTYTVKKIRLFAGT